MIKIMMIILASIINNINNENNNNVINNKVVLSACSPYFRKLLKVKMSKSTRNTANISINYRGKECVVADHRLKNYSLLTKVVLLAKPQSFLDIPLLLLLPTGNLKVAIKNN